MVQPTSRSSLHEGGFGHLGKYHYRAATHGAAPQCRVRGTVLLGGALEMFSSSRAAWRAELTINSAMRETLENP